jgi:hypothetical protein
MTRPLTTTFLTGALAVLFTLSFAITAQGFDYVLGEDFYTKPTIPKPAKGETITDPNFHTNITRITDKSIDGYSDDLMVPYYGRFNPENADGTRILLGAEFSYHLYNANPPYELIRKINPLSLGFLHSWSGGAIEAQWDANNPNIFYYILGSFAGATGEIDPSDYATFNSYNIATDTRTIIHDFKNEIPTATLVSVSTEGEPSANQQYWSWMVYGPSGVIAQIVYDKDADTIIHQIDNAPCGVDWITTSPDGGYSMANHMNCNSWYGQVYPWSGWPSHSGIALQQHSDTAYFFTPGIGKEQAHFGMDSAYDCIAVEDYDPNGYRLRLFNVCGGTGPYCASVEVSSSNFEKPGWGALRFYQQKGGGDWYDYQIVMVELNKDRCRYKTQGTTGVWTACAEPERIWRIAHTHDTGYDSGGGGYWAYWASINRKGTRLYFGSNWDTPGGQVETYMVELPETWWEDLSLGGPTSQSCSDQSGHYCTDRETWICPGQWLNANDTDACCSQPCQPDQDAPNVSVSHSPQNPLETEQVTLTATASDNVKLKEIRLYLDGQPVRTCSSSPCTNVSGPYPFGTHTYYATAEDYAGNPSRDPPSGEKNFNVTEDTFPPAISNVQSTPAPTSATITWETDEPANSLVKYGTQPGIYPESETYPAYVTQHSITLTGLLNSTTYYFVVNSTDQSGNSAQSSEQSFTTIEITDLALRLDFEEGSGTTATDSSGNDNHGTIYGAVHTDDSKTGSYALYFDGTDNYVAIPDSLSLRPSEITASAWIKCENCAGSEYILGKVKSGSTPSYAIYTNWPTEGIAFFIDDGSTYYKSPVGNPLVDGEWYHVVGTYDKNRVRLYINGTEVGSGTESTIDIGYSGAASLYIGGISSSYNFPGKIDDVRIYSRALSPQEILGLYKAGMSHPADTDQDGCIIMQELLAFIDHWKMDSTTYPMWEVMEAIGLWKSGAGCT